MKFHRPEFDHVFRSVSMECVIDPLRKVTITPSLDHPGFWHFEIWDKDVIDSTRLGRPIRKDGLSHLLEAWRFPSDESTWKPAESDVVPSLPVKKTMGAGLVYFLKGGPFVKIGFTTGPLSCRIDAIKTGCPYPIESLGCVAGTVQTERALHRKFRRYRANLEWFHESPDLLQFIAAQAVAA